MEDFVYQTLHQTLAKKRACVLKGVDGDIGLAATTGTNYVVWHPFEDEASDANLQHRLQLTLGAPANGTAVHRTAPVTRPPRSAS